MAGIERKGQQLGSIRVDEPKSRAKTKAAESATTEDTESTKTPAKKADTK